MMVVAVMTTGRITVERAPLNTVTQNVRVRVSPRDCAPYECEVAIWPSISSSSPCRKCRLARDLRALDKRGPCFRAELELRAGCVLRVPYKHMLAGTGDFYTVAVTVAHGTLTPSGFRRLMEPLVNLMHGTTVQDAWLLWLEFSELASDKSC